jgi:hypothetical protein
MRKRAILILIGLVLSTSAYADLYKCKQEDGTIIYTDRPCVSGEKLKLPSLQTYTAAPVPKDLFAKKDSSQNGEKSSQYDSLTILSPKNNTRIEATGSGNVEIVARAQPALRTVKGDVFAIVMDGKQLPTTGVTNTIRLQNVNRGTHSIQILILSRNRSVLQTSNTVSFTVGRQNIYNRAPNSQTPISPAAQPAPAASRAPKAP